MSNLSRASLESLLQEQKQSADRLRADLSATAGAIQTLEYLLAQLPPDIVPDGASMESGSLANDAVGG